MIIYDAGLHLKVAFNLACRKFSACLKEYLQDLNYIYLESVCGLQISYLRLKLLYSGFIIRRLESKLFKIK